MSVAGGPPGRLLPTPAIHAAAKPRNTAAAVETEAIQSELTIGRRRSGWEKTEAQFVSESAGGRISIVHVPGGTNEAKRSIACGSRRIAAKTQTAAATAAPRESVRRAGAAPRGAPRTPRRFFVAWRREIG